MPTLSPHPPLKHDSRDTLSGLLMSGSQSDVENSIAAATWGRMGSSGNSGDRKFGGGGIQAAASGAVEQRLTQLRCPRTEPKRPVLAPMFDGENDEELVTTSFYDYSPDSVWVIFADVMIILNGTVTGKVVWSEDIRMVHLFLAEYVTTIIATIPVCMKWLSEYTGMIRIHLVLRGFSEWCAQIWGVVIIYCQLRYGCSTFSLFFYNITKAIISWIVCFCYVRFSFFCSSQEIGLAERAYLKWPFCVELVFQKHIYFYSF